MHSTIWVLLYKGAVHILCRLFKEGESKIANSYIMKRRQSVCLRWMVKNLRFWDDIVYGRPHTTACKTYVPSLTGKCFFLGGMALNLVSFQFSKMSIPPNILPTVSLLGPVSAEDRRTRSMGKLSSFKLSMFKIDEAEPRSVAASVLVLQTNLDLRKMLITPI